MFDMCSSYCENFIYISLSMIAMWHGIFENWRITKMSFQRKRSIPWNITETNRGVEFMLLNGWQLAKMKKSIPDMSLSWNLYGWSSWSKKLQKYLKNYDICENVKFGAISWKFDILSITA